MTGPEQLQVNELGHLVRSLIDANEDYRKEQRAATAEILDRLRSLEDSRLRDETRDAILADQRSKSETRNRWLTGTAVAIIAVVTSVLVRALGIG